MTMVMEVSIKALGEAAQTTDRILVFLIDIMASSISHVGRRNPFQDQTVMFQWW